MYDRDQNILKYIDSGMDLSNFKSILQNNKQDLKNEFKWKKHILKMNIMTLYIKINRRVVI